MLSSETLPNGRGRTWPSGAELASSLPRSVNAETARSCTHLRRERACVRLVGGGGPTLSTCQSTGVSCIRYVCFVQACLGMKGVGLELSIGERVAFYRRRRGLTQQALSGLVGRTPSWVEKVENGRAPLDRISVVRELARALDVSLHDLLPDD